MLAIRVRLHRNVEGNGTENTDGEDDARTHADEGGKDWLNDGKCDHSSDATHDV